MDREQYTLERIKEVRDELRALKLQLQHHARRLEALEVQEDLVSSGADLERLEERQDDLERRIRSLEDAA